jgi:hypothetical protein
MIAAPSPVTPSALLIQIARRATNNGADSVNFHALLGALHSAYNLGVEHHALAGESAFASVSDRQMTLEILLSANVDFPIGDLATWTDAQCRGAHELACKLQLSSLSGAIIPGPAPALLVAPASGAASAPRDAARGPAPIFERRLNERETP